jgi:hypothetical protein
MDCTWGHIQVMSPCLVPTRIFYLTPGTLPPRPSPGCLLCWSLVPLPFLFLELRLPRLSILCLADQGFGNPFSAPTRLWPWWVGPPLVLTGLCPLQAASLWCFALSCIAPLALPSLFWEPWASNHLMLVHPGLRRIWTAHKWFCHPRG